MQQTQFYSNGKLLLSGEYLVLHGAKALALPLKVGQDLLVEYHDDIKSEIIHWKGYEDKILWFEAQFSKSEFRIANSSDHLIAKKLEDVLQKARTLNSNFLTSQQSYSVQTNLNFKKGWGFGSSSTLINNIAKWAHVDPYKLLDISFGGSGYDIACAEAKHPIFYSKTEGGTKVVEANFQPEFKHNLFFVYLGKKQDTSESIHRFNNLGKAPAGLIEEISELSSQMAAAKTLDEFNFLIGKHEEIMSTLLKIPSVKKNNFSDFKGEIKSLGAWGGDFILVTSKDVIAEVKKYFAKYNLKVVFSYDKLVK